jgi:hypothetical protein
MDDEDMSVPNPLLRDQRNDENSIDSMKELK